MLSYRQRERHWSFCMMKMFRTCPCSPLREEMIVSVFFLRGLRLVGPFLWLQACSDCRAAEPPMSPLAHRDGGIWCL